MTALTPPLHIPPLHPAGHSVSTCTKLHVPAAHVPGADNVRSVVAVTHVAAGGVSHKIGCPAHDPFEQKSLLVHASPSSQGASAANVFAQMS
jgi:hypothetical protein